jgi:hypothetical protein
MSADDDDDYRPYSVLGGQLTWSMRAVSALTILSCLLVVFIYLRHKTIRGKNINKVVFYIASCQIGTAIGTMIGQPYNYTAECFVQTVFTNYFIFAYTFWTTVAAYMLYRVIHRLSPLDISSYYIHGLCWGLPVLLTFLPLTTDAFGNEDTDRGWCFIRNLSSSPEYTVTMWVALNYSFLAVSVFFSILFISLSLYRVLNLSKSIGDKQTISKLSKSISRFIWYPIISFICWLPESIYDINDTLNSGHNTAIQNDKGFVYIAILLPISEGLWVAIAYFCTSQDAREILMSYIYCKSTVAEEAGQLAPHQFQMSSDPEDYDERDTEALQTELKGSSTPSPFQHFHSGNAGHARNLSDDSSGAEMMGISGANSP